FNNQKINMIGQAVFGFGALFFGLKLMSGGMAPLKDLDVFHELTLSMSDNAFLGVAIGTVFTLIVQSSSATTGILQGLFSEQAIDLQAAVPVLFGDNLGTTIASRLATSVASVAASRAALTHVIFNLIGLTVFTLIMHPFIQFTAFLKDALTVNPEMTLAFAHASYNIANTAMQFSFIGTLAWLVTKIIQGKDVTIEYKPQHLDPLFVKQSPTVALSQAKAAIIRKRTNNVNGVNE